MNCSKCEYWDLESELDYPTGLGRKCKVLKRTERYGEHFTLGRFSCDDFKERSSENTI
jgi:hypothetical protein